jgi:hypothetical protein
MISAVVIILSSPRNLKVRYRYLVLIVSHSVEQGIANNLQGQKGYVHCSLYPAYVGLYI